MSHQQEKAVGWMLHALKIVLGDESIRRYIILYYYPTISNASKKCIRTFDAFVETGKKREDKANEIRKYCTKICTKPDKIVFTASNIQKTPCDNETHFQSYIIDNNLKHVSVIDPAYDSSKQNNFGIYFAEISIEVIVPFFQRKGYTTEFVSLVTPAQIDVGDVFCQSWTLYILLAMLKQNEYLTTNTFDIPKDQLDKYDMLLCFYHQIFTDMPELHENLQVEYKGEILESRGPNRLTKIEKEYLLKFDPIELLFGLTKYEMQK
jgi:hypothetical protein